jgi:hypothetical protein
MCRLFDQRIQKIFAGSVAWPDCRRCAALGHAGTSERRSVAACQIGPRCATGNSACLTRRARARDRGTRVCCQRLLTDRRPMIDDRVGDRRVVTLGLPGHGRPCVALRRTDSAGRPKALVRPAELLRFPAALGLDRPAPSRGPFNTHRSRASCSLYNTRTPCAVRFPSAGCADAEAGRGLAPQTRVHCGWRWSQRPRAPTVSRTSWFPLNPTREPE